MKLNKWICISIWLPVCQVRARCWCLVFFVCFFRAKAFVCKFHCIRIMPTQYFSPEWLIHTKKGWAGVSVGNGSWCSAVAEGATTINSGLYLRGHLSCIGTNTLTNHVTLWWKAIAARSRGGKKRATDGVGLLLCHKRWVSKRFFYIHHRFIWCQLTINLTSNCGSCNFKIDITVELYNFPIKTMHNSRDSGSK